MRNAGGAPSEHLMCVRRSVGCASISNPKDEFIGITFGGSSKPDMPTGLERKWVGGGGP
jgi:hypothetical protein